MFYHGNCILIITGYKRVRNVCPNVFCPIFIFIFMVNNWKNFALFWLYKKVFAQNSYTWPKCRLKLQYIDKANLSFRPFQFRPISISANFKFRPISISANLNFGQFQFRPISISANLNFGKSQFRPISNSANIFL